MAISILAMACSEPEAKLPNQNPVTTGTWELTTVSLGLAADLDNDGIPSSDLMVETACFGSSGVMLNADGTATITLENLGIELNAIPGTEEPAYEYTVTCTGAVAQAASYSIAGNNITVSLPNEQYMVFVRSGDILTLTIPELTDLPVVNEAEEEEGEGEGEEIITSPVSATFIFTLAE